MKISMLEVSLVELEDAVDFYNDECPGLGYEFADDSLRVRHGKFSYTRWL